MKFNLMNRKTLKYAIAALCALTIYVVCGYALFNNDSIQGYIVDEKTSMLPGEEGNKLKTWNITVNSIHCSRYDWLESNTKILRIFQIIWHPYLRVNSLLNIGMHQEFGIQYTDLR